MSATRDPDRRLRAWLDLMPDEAPDRAIASVLQATEHAPQARRLLPVAPWRSPMNRFSLIAAVAVIAIALVGGVYLLGSGRSGPAQPTPAPTPGATAAPSPTFVDAVAPLPAITLGDWLADAAVIPGVTTTPQQIQLSFNWDGGMTAWVQLNGENGRLVVQSSSLVASTGEVRLRADIANTGCVFGEDGRYRWSRSADGMFLTLELIEDACAPRSAALARTWVHSLGAVNDGGPGVVNGVTPMTQVTLPTGQRYGAGGGDQWQDVGTFGDVQPFRAFVVVRNPGGFGAPCSTTAAQAMDLDHTTDAFVAYIKGLPGATVTTSTTTIGGRPSVRLDVSIAAAVQCPAGEIRAFHAETFDAEPLSDVPGWWAFGYGETQPVYIVQMDATTTFLLWYEGTGAEEQAVLASIKFIDVLPTP